MPEAGAAVEIGDRGERSRFRLLTSGFVLSALSFATVLYTAGAEPFLVFRWFDLVLNVGLGTLLFALFAIWAARCVRHLRTPHPSAGRTLLACACVLWTAVNLFYLGTTVYGYGQDMTNPTLHPVR